MKELTIKEKAEAYDEALERVNKLQKTCDSTTVIGWCEYIFPELRESDDEKIRKNLIEWIEDFPDMIWRGHYKKDVIAWLEKQGKKELENYDEAEKEKVDFVGDGFIECHADFLDFKEGETYWLEYIGDDKYNVRSDNLLGKTYHITPCQLYTVFKKLTWLEKQGEQKTADNVEPRFKVGDWIVQENIGVYKVIEICESWYEVVDGEDNHYSISFDKEYMCRLWDIAKDAKDGDAIQLGGVTAIFKEYISNPYCKCYCSVYDEEFGIPRQDGEDNIYGCTNATPATKEQRDLLFQKMKEAGYEWDSEKKELKKIEHKHTCKLDNSYACVTFPFKAKVKSSGKIVTIHGGQLNQGGGEWIKYQSNVEDGFRVYEANDLELVCEIEPTSAWSEEDEIDYNYALAACIHYGETKGYADTEIHQKTKNWLKSIKYRYFWKPSDEQMEAFEHFVRSWGESGISSPYDNYTKLIYSLLQDLKKLKE